MLPRIQEKKWLTCFTIISCFVCYYFITYDLQDGNIIPLSTKLKALQLLNMVDRATEEKDRIATDIRCCVIYYKKKHEKIMSVIRSMQQVDANSALLWKRLFIVECLLVELLPASNDMDLFNVKDFAFKHNTLPVDDDTEATSDVDCIGTDIDDDYSDDEFLQGDVDE
jgi:hypothetical protein